MTVYLPMRSSILVLWGYQIMNSRVVVPACRVLFVTLLVSCAGNTNVIEKTNAVKPSAGSVVLTATTCRVPVVTASGEAVDMTVGEYLSSLDDDFERYNTDSDSCDIFTATANPAVSLFNNLDGAGLDISFGTHSVLIDSEQRYSDCARDIQVAASARIGRSADSCPALVRLNLP